MPVELFGRRLSCVAAGEPRRRSQSSDSSCWALVIGPVAVRRTVGCAAGRRYLSEWQ